jgi:hypothetical protein
MGFARVDEARVRWGDEDDGGPALLRGLNLKPQRKPAATPA